MWVRLGPGERFARLRNACVRAAACLLAFHRPRLPLVLVLQPPSSLAVPLSAVLAPSIPHLVLPDRSARPSARPTSRMRER
eukprot:2661103-Prymnesium_polylepis.1